MMSEIIKLAAVSRDQMLPNVEYVLAEAYGPKAGNLHLAIAANVLDKILAVAAKSQLIDLQVDAQTIIKVLVKEVQRDPLKNKAIHVDLLCIDPDTKIKTQLQLKQINISPAVVSKGAILATNASKVDVECLPSALVSYLEVDLSKLIELGDVIRVEDLTIPAGMEIKNDPHMVLVTSITPRKIKEETTETVAVPVEGEATPAEGEAKAEGEVKAQGEVKDKKSK